MRTEVVLPRSLHRRRRAAGRGATGRNTTTGVPVRITASMLACQGLSREIGVRFSDGKHEVLCGGMILLVLLH